MTHLEDDPEELLLLLDPVRTDPAPTRGSTRYESILERAMNTPSTEQLTTGPEVRSQPGSFAERLDRRRLTGSRRYALAGVAAALLLAIATVVALRTDERPSAATAVENAAARTSEITRLRARLTRGSGEDPGSVTRAEVDGPNLRLTYLGDDGPTVMTIIGNTVWETTDGKTTSEPYDPIAHGRRAPFGSASEAVVRAALQSSEVERIGVEQVGGVDATRYRIRLTDSTRVALSNLGPTVLTWFELTEPEKVTEIDVWVTDDLIHRIQVTGNWDDSVGSRTMDYYDLNADVTITAPS